MLNENPVQQKLANIPLVLVWDFHPQELWLFSGEYKLRPSVVNSLCCHWKHRCKITGKITVQSSDKEKCPYLHILHAPKVFTRHPSPYIFWIRSILIFTLRIRHLVTSQHYQRKLAEGHPSVRVHVWFGLPANKCIFNLYVKNMCLKWNCVISVKLKNSWRVTDFFHLMLTVHI